MSEYELIARRVSKLTDNKDVEPVDLLKTVIHDIESGETPCDGIFVVVLKRESDGQWSTARYRSKLNSPETIALLRCAEHATMCNWLGR